MTVGDIYTLTPLRRDIDVLIPLEDVTLEGFLSAPKHTAGMVICAYASDAARYIPRNQHMTRLLNKRRFATLLVDLLMPAEEADETHELRLNIDLLAGRIEGLVRWVGCHAKICNKPIGLSVSATAAAAALVVDAKQPGLISAIVSRGGRIDLAQDFLKAVTAPTLLIVGGNDHEILELNEKALGQLNRYSELAIVPEASHLFEENGALEETMKLSAAWFVQHASNHTNKEVL